MKKLFLVFVALVFINLYAGDNRTGRVAVQPSDTDLTFVDFVINRVGLSNLNFAEANLLYQAGLFGCKNISTGVWSAPININGSYVCGYLSVYQKDTRTTNFNPVALFGDEQCLPDTGKGIIDDKLFKLDDIADEDKIVVWHPLFPYGGYYTHDYRVVGIADEDKLSSFKDDFINIIDKASGNYYYNTLYSCPIQ